MSDCFNPDLHERHSLGRVPHIQGRQVAPPQHPQPQLRPLTQDHLLPGVNILQKGLYLYAHPYHLIIITHVIVLVNYSYEAVYKLALVYNKFNSILIIANYFPAFSAVSLAPVSVSTSQAPASPLTRSTASSLIT